MRLNLLKRCANMQQGNFVPAKFLDLSSLKYFSRGDLDSIKTLVSNGVDCSIGNADLRTVATFLFSVSIKALQSLNCYTYPQAAHIAAAEGMISVLDFLMKQVLKNVVGAT